MSCKDCGFVFPNEKEETEAGETSDHLLHLKYTTWYGACPKCTPKKLAGLIEAMQEARIDAGREFEVLMAPKRKAFIDKKSAKHEKKILKLYNSKRPASVEEKTSVAGI